MPVSLPMCYIQCKSSREAPTWARGSCCFHKRDEAPVGCLPVNTYGRHGICYMGALKEHKQTSNKIRETIHFYNNSHGAIPILHLFYIIIILKKTHIRKGRQLE